MDKIFSAGEILLPHNEAMPLWSVIACDQYSSRPDYWEDVENRVGDQPSTLKLMIPEAFLETRDPSKLREQIKTTMNEYLNGDVFRTIKDSYIYVERDMTVGEKRRGIMGLMDLEEYNFRKGSVSSIRSTEGTVESRLPARVELRKEASIELPHVVLFIDDPDNIVFSSLETGDELYNFDLMDGGGHIIGKQISGKGAEKLDSALSDLWSRENLEKRYGPHDGGYARMAVGDGNHSLAAARLCWEEIKANLSPEEQKNHPARFALVELVNIHDKSIQFQPIHRLISKTDPSAFLNEAKEYFSNISKGSENQRELTLYAGNESASASISGYTVGEIIALAQKFCENYMENHGGEIDYIHDDDALISLSSKENSCGILLPTIRKDELFGSIIKSGPFPAKSFSIGPAKDKRYYLECRKIK